MQRRGAERRKHRRAELRCPVTLRDTEGNALAKARAENVSDGGVFLSIPINSLPHFGIELDVSFSVPRTTPNTYMLEEFNCKARIVRHQPMVNCDQAGMGLQFVEAQELMLEV